MQHYSTVVIGGGPAGLTAAYELSKKDHKSVVLEKADRVGGISRTETYKGYRFDIGGHRFFTKVTEVEQLWHEVLENDFIRVPRMSRIFYDGKFFSYPLEPFDALTKLGLIDSMMIMLSYMKIKMRPLPEEENLEQWVTNRFGERLYRTFFKTYTEKVWGIPCTKIQADWAAQRIKGLSLKKAVLNALFKVNNTKTLIKEFEYPRLGPGMMWERFQEKLDAFGSPVHLNTNVIGIEREGQRIKSITAIRDEQLVKFSGDNFVSSMPVSLLLNRLNPAPPEYVLEAARGLKYRDFLIVSLVVNKKHLFPDNWIYIHSPEFKVGRIQNFKNWSPEMVPDPDKTCLGMEYFCSEGDDLWEMSNEDLIALASREVVGLGLVDDIDRIEDGTVIRQYKAYPVYDGEYRGHLDVIQEYLETFENLQTTGRNGMHRYNNQDHSMLTGMLAAKNILGEEHDLWNVNVERSYHEEFTKDGYPKKETPEPAGASV
ncbi:MAG: NAD(P)/FAD-dependent oxidoreductase [Cyanobacteriota bacterium]|nr:NAD(P)/FAD-dependent oxidoreductase [Cyanobacteriota bacterium]